MTVRVSVNGTDVGRDSDVIIVLRPGMASGCAEAEALVEVLTGRLASTWTDGTGTTTVMASGLPVPGVCPLMLVPGEGSVCDG
jgi:hypothetical protein